MTSPLRNFDTACHIVGAVCQHFGVTLAQLESHARPERLVWPRFVAIGLICKHTDWDQITISAFMGRTRLSVPKSLKAFHNRVDTSAKARVEVAAIEMGLPLSPPVPNPGSATKTHRNSINAQSEAIAKDAGGKT